MELHPIPVIDLFSHQELLIIMGIYGQSFSDTIILFGLINFCIFRSKIPILTNSFQVEFTFEIANAADEPKPATPRTLGFGLWYVACNKFTTLFHIHFSGIHPKLFLSSMGWRQIGTSGICSAITTDSQDWASSSLCLIEPIRSGAIILIKLLSSIIFSSSYS